MMSKILKIIPPLLVLAVMLGSSCAHRPGALETYATPELRQQEIKSVALMPIRDIWLTPEEGGRLDGVLAQMVKKEYPGIYVRDGNEVSDLLDQLTLKDRWQNYYDDYSIRGVPDTALIALVGEALGVDAIIQSEIADVRLSDASNQLLENLPPQDRTELPDTTVRPISGTVDVQFSLSMFGVKVRDLVWQASAGGQTKTSNNPTGDLPISIAAREAMEKITQALPLR
jgi:hypothetical protein